MFREAVIWEFALWGDGRIAIKWWLVTERRCGVRIKQLMLRMARLTYGVWGTRVIWCQIVLGKLETSVEGGCPHSPNSRFLLSTLAPPNFSAVTSSSTILLQDLGLVVHRVHWFSTSACVSYWAFESFVLVWIALECCLVFGWVFPQDWFVCTVVDKRL